MSQAILVSNARERADMHVTRNSQTQIKNSLFLAREGKYLLEIRFDKNGRTCHGNPG